MLVYIKPISWHKNVWPGHNLVILSFTETTIKIETYQIVEKEEEDVFVVGEDEGIVYVSSLINDKSRKEKARVLESFTYTLDQFRTHPQFKDLSTFGIGGTRRDIMYANIDPGKQIFPSFGDYHMIQGYPFSLIFPDTESTFADAVMLIPEFRNGEMEIHHNGVNMGRITFEGRILSSKELPIMRLIFPTIGISGPEEIKAGSVGEFTVSLSDSPLGYESIYHISVDCDNGFLPLRSFQLGAGDSRVMKINTTGLEKGDTVRVKAGIDAEASIADLRIRLV